MLNNQLLTDEHKESYRGFCEYVKEHVVPFAADWDRERGVPRKVIEQLK